MNMVSDGFEQVYKVPSRSCKVYYVNLSMQTYKVPFYSCNVHVRQSMQIL